MDYVPDAVKDLWKDAALDFNKIGGGFGTSCRLTFAVDIRPTENIIIDTASSKFRFMPPPGGLSSPNPIKNYQESSFPTSSGYYQAETNKVIEGRVYGARSEFLRDFQTEGTVQSTQNVWKFVCDKIYSPDLIRCSFATFYYGSSREFKAKLLKPPMSYGLAADVNCVSYWVDV